MTVTTSWADGLERWVERTLDVRATPVVPKSWREDAGRGDHPFAIEGGDESLLVRDPLDALNQVVGHVLAECDTGQLEQLAKATGRADADFDAHFLKIPRQSRNRLPTDPRARPRRQRENVSGMIVGVLGVFVLWIPILISGRYPEWAVTLYSGLLRYQVRVGAYIMLLPVPYPPFSLK
jgi:Domain of unknown function (DUF4389)